MTQLSENPQRGINYFVAAAEAPDEVGVRNRIARHIMQNVEGQSVWVEPSTPWPYAYTHVDRLPNYTIWHHASVVREMALEQTISQDDHIFLADAAFPGLEQLARLYPQTHILGYFHGMEMSGGWREDYSLDDFVFPFLSKVLVPTPYSYSKSLWGNEKFQVVGSPFDPSSLSPYPRHKKEHDVVWIKGRGENFGKFLDIARGLKEVGRRVSVLSEHTPFTKEEIGGLLGAGCQFQVVASKAHYRSILASSRVILSTLLNETWAYDVMEAVELGCVPLVPSSGCFPYQYPATSLYAQVSPPLKVAAQANYLIQTNVKPPTVPVVTISGRFSGGQFIPSSPAAIVP